MCEHKFVFGRINATHCKRCNDTEQEVVLREQLAAANARVAELEATLKEIAKGNIVYPDLFAQQSLKDTKNSGCPHGVQPSKRCCKVCNELENILFKCNQEIVKQACKTEQLQQQLVAANQRAEQAEAQCAAMQTSINRYVIGNIELLDAMKAALEQRL